MPQSYKRAAELWKQAAAKGPRENGTEDSPGQTLTDQPVPFTSNAALQTATNAAISESASPPKSEREIKDERRVEHAINMSAKQAKQKLVAAEKIEQADRDRIAEAERLEQLKRANEIRAHEIEKATATLSLGDLPSPPKGRPIPAKTSQAGPRSPSQKRMKRAQATAKGAGKVTAEDKEEPPSPPARSAAPPPKGEAHHPLRAHPHRTRASRRSDANPAPPRTRRRGREGEAKRSWRRRRRAGRLRRRRR